MTIVIEGLDYDKNLFIFGETVQTHLGKIRFLTYREYLTIMPELSLVTQNTLHIYYQYKKQIDANKNSDNEVMEALKELKESELLEVVLSTQQMLNAYLKVFRLVFDMNEDNPIEQIFSNVDNFNFIRRLVMDMNVLTEEKVSQNEEIQKAMERSKRVKQQNSEEQSFVDIVTSIVASTSNSFEDVCNMNVFQVYAIYARIGAIFNYQTTTLFATVAEKVSIESWNKHINLFESSDDVISEKEFKNKFGGLLKM